MAKFEKTQVALGEFWGISDPLSRWPGELRMDGFPTLDLFKLGHFSGLPSLSTEIMHGISKDGEHFTLFDVSSGRPSCWNCGLGSPNPNPHDIPDSSHALSFTGNYLLVSNRLHNGNADVQKITFSSKVVEDSFGLWPPHTYDRAWINKLKLGRGVPDQEGCVAEYADTSSGIKTRIFKSLVPKEYGPPSSFVTVEFQNPIKPKEALKYLITLRALFTLLCGKFVDLKNVQFGHYPIDFPTDSLVYFFNKNDRIETTDLVFPAIAALMRSPELFQKIMERWSSEPEARRMMRGNFANMLLDDTSISLSHLGEVVTLLEMVAVDHKPLQDKDFKKLKKELVKAIRSFEPSSGAATDWRDLLKDRMPILNSRNTKPGIIEVIKELPDSILNVANEDWPLFIEGAVSLRNKITHDISKLEQKDFENLTIFVMKLRMIYALDDALSLGLVESEIDTWYTLIRLAQSLPSITRERHQE